MVLVMTSPEDWKAKTQEAWDNPSWKEAAEEYHRNRPRRVALVSDDSDETWPEMDEAAYYGLAGDVVRIIEPDSESDPVAILAQYLCTFGNIVGNTPYFLIESDRHTANLFEALVGVSAKGRKGTSGSRVRAVAKIADQNWFMERSASGLSSGEGLIYAVRNPISKWNALWRRNLLVRWPRWSGTAIH